MLGITIEIDNQAFEEDVRKLAAEFPKAAARAVNATADKVLEGLVEVIDRTVDNPTAFTLDAFAATSASRSSKQPSATVYVKDEQAEYLRYLFEGGTLTKPGGVLVPGRGAQLDRHGNFPDGYLEMVETTGGWWMTTRAGLKGLFVRNAHGEIEAIAIETRKLRYEKKADFHDEVAAVVKKELPRQLADAFKATFG